MQIVDVLKALGDETRIRVATLLYDYPCFVRDIYTILELQQSNTSRHLQRLVTSKVIASKPCGQSRCYYIVPDMYNNELVKQIIFAYKQSEQSQKDQNNLDAYIQSHPEMIEKLTQYKMLKE